ncbi:hypothetical protein AAZX31_18G061700 [Glycine max]
MLPNFISKSDLYREDDVLEHHDREGVVSEDKVEDDTLEHCNREGVVGEDELEDDALKQYIKEGSVNGEEEVEDNVLRSNTHKLMKPLLAVCCLVKNRENKGDRRRRKKNDIFCDSF